MDIYIYIYINDWITVIFEWYIIIFVKKKKKKKKKGFLIK